MNEPACSTIAANGIKGDSIFTPHCFWVEDCRRRDSCYWARFHQLDKIVKARPVGVRGQGELFDELPSSFANSNHDDSDT